MPQEAPAKSAAAFLIFLCPAPETSAIQPCGHAAKQKRRICMPVTFNPVGAEPEAAGNDASLIWRRRYGSGCMGSWEKRWKRLSSPLPAFPFCRLPQTRIPRRRKGLAPSLCRGNFLCGSCCGAGGIHPEEQAELPFVPGYSAGFPHTPTNRSVPSSAVIAYRNGRSSVISMFSMGSAIRMKPSAV